MADSATPLPPLPTPPSEEGGGAVTTGGRRESESNANAPVELSAMALGCEAQLAHIALYDTTRIAVLDAHSAQMHLFNTQQHSSAAHSQSRLQQILPGSANARVASSTHTDLLADSSVRVRLRVVLFFFFFFFFLNTSRFSFFFFFFFFFFPTG
jgi:hypothetical protein